MRDNKSALLGFKYVNNSRSNYIFNLTKYVWCLNLTECALGTFGFLMKLYNHVLSHYAHTMYTSMNTHGEGRTLQPKAMLTQHHLFITP